VGGHKLFFTLDMIATEVSHLLLVLDVLQAMEKECSGWPKHELPKPDRLKIVEGFVEAARINCELLQLRSAIKQVMRILLFISTENGRFATDLPQMISELRVRIGEDIQDCVFYCVNETPILQKFFKRDPEAALEDPMRVPPLIYKQLEEIFDRKMIERFPETIDDFIAAAECFVKDCFTAAVFHLMRVIEFGILQIAFLAEIHDPKPSWGAVLGKLDKYAYRTDYKDLPPKVQPNIELIRKLLPKMHAVQHAWRNKIIHVGHKLIPEGEIGEHVAREIMDATEALMRVLAEELPASAPKAL
jgi:hypothetical protein